MYRKRALRGSGNGNPDFEPRRQLDGETMHERMQHADDLERNRAANEREYEGMRNDAADEAPPGWARTE